MGFTNQAAPMGTVQVPNEGFLKLEMQSDVGLFLNRTKEMSYQYLDPNAVDPFSHSDGTTHPRYPASSHLYHIDMLTPFSINNSFESKHIHR